MPRRKKRELEEEHENHERWMVTYADMVTLLMVLFIVMFAMGQVDEEKYAKLQAGLSSGFGQDSTVMTGGTSLLDKRGTTGVESVTPEKGAVLTPQEQQAVDEEVRRQEQQRAARRYAEAVAEVDRLRTIQARIKTELATANLGDDVVTTINQRGLVVSLVSKHVVFQAHRAELTPRGAQVVRTLASVLRDIPDDLEVDGHTNQVKVAPKYYATDWDLSSARAITVLRYLQEDLGIPGKRLTASAFGHEKPLMDPKTKGSQRINKRVDIVVLSSIAAESRELLEQVANGRGENE